MPDEFGRPDSPQPFFPGAGGGGGSGGTGTPDPYYAPPEPGEQFPGYNPYFFPAPPSVGSPEPTSPPGPDPGTPPAEQPPGIGFPSGPTPSWVDYGASVFGSIFGPRRRAPQTTPQLERQLLNRYLRGLGRFVGDYMRGGGASTPQAPLRPLSSSRELTRYVSRPVARVLQAAPRFGAGIASRLLGGLGLFLYPSAIEPDRFTQAEMLERAGMLPLPPLPDYYIPPRVVLAPPPREYRDLGFRFFLDKERAGLGNNYGYQWLLSQVPGLRGPEQGPPPPNTVLRSVGPGQMISTGLPQPGPTAPTPEQTPVQQTSQSSAPQQILAPRSTTGKGSRRRQRLFTFGGLGTLILLIEANQRRGGGSPSPIIPGAPVPVPVPTPTPTATPSTPTLTPFNPVLLGFSGGGAGGDECNCAPRGPRRKCLQRAPVKFTGGPRKGRPAGTKCIKFSARRS